MKETTQTERAGGGCPPPSCSLLVDAESVCRDALKAPGCPPWVHEAATMAVAGLEKLNSMSEATTVDSLECGSHLETSARQSDQAGLPDTPQLHCAASQEHNMTSKFLTHYYDDPIMDVIGEGTVIQAVSPESPTATRYSLTLSNGTLLEFTSMTDGGIAVSILPNDDVRAPLTGAEGRNSTKEEQP